MEEMVGRWWHQAMMHLTRPEHAAHEVRLSEVRQTIALMFRAAGGVPSLRLAEASPQRVGGLRNWKQRLSGAGERATLCVLDAEVLALPPALALFADVTLNRDLYIWWAMLAAHFETGRGWLAANHRAAAQALLQFPGFAGRYQRLLQAHLLQRPTEGELGGRQARAEAAVLATLRGLEPVGQECSPAEVAPVWLWVMAPAPALAAAARPAESPAAEDASRPLQVADPRRRRVQQAPDDRSRSALVLPFRAEALMSWSDMVRVDRSTDDEDDGNALKAASDMDTLSLGRDGRSLAARVRFDLDLPSASADDLPLGPRESFPEWDYKRHVLMPAHCMVQVMVAREAPAAPEVLRLNPALRRISARVRRRFETLRDAPHWRHGQDSGEDLDLDALVRMQSDDLSGRGGRSDMPAVFRRRVLAERSLATLLLADLSQSTDAHAHGEARVIDVIRDALTVFCDALDAVGDPLSVWGFSSVRRHQVRMQFLKGFDEPWDARVRSRVAAIRPGYYTRMGAALRHATRELQGRSERRRLLLLLTDGKPNDLDHYEGRHGLEDTRHAIHEARQAGLTPFAITIDAQAQDYLPMLFGPRGFALVRRPQDLVQRLAMAWSTLARRG